MSGERPALRLPQLPPRLTVRQRFAAVGRRWRQLLRLAAATSAAYAISTHLLGHEQAFFAPVAAVIVLLAGVGLRHRLLVELVLGVAVGVLVGELLILATGRGAWQLALIVVLTFSAAVFMGLKGVSLTQAANSGVLLAAVVPAVGADNPAMTRFVDSLVGGACGLAMVLLLPRNATRDIDKEVRPLLEHLEGILEQVARALRAGDAAQADAALERARGLQSQVNSASATAAAATEVAHMSPVRWYQRTEVARYAQVLVDIDNAIRDARVLARRVSSMLRMGETGGDELCEAVECLARGVQIFEAGLSDPAAYARAQDELVESVRLAVGALTDQMTLNRAAVVAQVRSLAADVLFASGMSRDELDVRLNF
ncbi:MAG: aromatic acid exporter family protein [Nocardioides sp.]|uniref:FUSC family protein n=1 Tax=Nocardioides sp. TaxID=35761 RepID=UPI003F125315